jgi:membrane dipeptidase
MHFDLPMDLYEKRQRRDVLETEFSPEFEAGNVSVVGAAIYIEDRYLPEAGLRVALDQIARLYAETAASERFAICKNYREVQAAREAGRRLSSRWKESSVGTDLNQLRVFYELGVRAIGLTTPEPMRRIRSFRSEWLGG